MDRPWQGFAVLACLWFAALYWFVPSLLEGPLQSLAGVTRSFAWLLLLLLGLVSLIAFLRGRTPGGVADRGQRSSAETRLASPTSSEQARAPLAASPSRSTLDDGPFRTLPPLPRPPAPPTFEDKPTSWSTAVLTQMEWKRLEHLAAGYYWLLGFRAETLRCGADGGIDIKLYRGELREPVSIVQCKAWTDRPVGVKPVRELLGVMTQQQVATGVFVTTSTFTSEAREFARGNRMALVDGEELLGKLLNLPENAREALLRMATDGEWKVPSCPSCGTKMRARHRRSKQFWGCTGFPRCRLRFPMRPRQLLSNGEGQ